MINPKFRTPKYRKKSVKDRDDEYNDIRDQENLQHLLMKTIQIHNKI